MRKYLLALTLALLLPVAAYAGGLQSMQSAVMKMWNAGGVVVTYLLNATFTMEAPGSGTTNSYDFTRASDHHITVADHDDFSFTDGSDNDSAFSICAWLEWDGTGGSDQSLVAKYSSLQEWNLRVNDSDGIEFFLYDDSVAAYIGRSSPDPNPASDWLHVCATYDGNECATNCDTSINIYNNGVAIDDADFTSGSYTGMENLAADVEIGRAGVGNTEIDGRLSTVLITSDVLSQSEIDTIMESDCAEIDASALDNVVGCWDLAADTNADIGSHDGTAQNGVAPAVPVNYPGKVIEIGTNSYEFVDTTATNITVADHNDFSFTDGSDNDAPFSLAFWAKYEGGGPWYWASKYSSGQYEWILLYTSSEWFQFYTYDVSASAFIGRSTGVEYVPGVWVHVAATYDGNECTVDCATSYKIYLNGEQADTGDYTGGSYVGMENGTADFVLSNSGVGQALPGNMAKFLLTSDVLTPAEVGSIMDAQNCSAIDALIDNEVGCWDLDEDTNADIGSHNATANNGIAPSDPVDFPVSTTAIAIVDTQVLDTPFWGVTTGALYLDDASNANNWAVLTNNKLSTADTTQSGYAGAQDQTNYGHAIGTTFMLNSQKQSTTDRFAMGWTEQISPCAFTGVQDYFGLGNMVSSATVYARGRYGGSTYLAPLGFDLADMAYDYSFVVGGFDSSGVPYKDGDTKSSFDCGVSVFMKGGTLTNWTNMWRYTGGCTASATNLHPTSCLPTTAHTGSGVKIDTFRVPDADLSLLLQPTALDTFTGTNGQTLESGGTYSGTDVNPETSWHKRTDECAGGIGNGDWQIDTNTVENDQNGADCTYNAWEKTVYLDSGDADVIAGVQMVVNTAGGQQGGLLFRGSAETAAGMNAWFLKFETDDLFLSKYDDGSETAVASDYATGISDATTHTLRAITDGDSIITFLDEEDFGDTTQTFNNTATRVGLHKVGTADKTFDNFVVWPRGTGGEYDAILDLY